MFIAVTRTSAKAKTFRRFLAKKWLFLLGEGSHEMCAGAVKTRALALWEIVLRK